MVSTMEDPEGDEWNFDVEASHAGRPPRGGPLVAAGDRPPKRPQIPWWKQLILYFFLVLGVFFSSAVRMLEEDKPLNLMLDLKMVIISLIIALVLAPQAFKILDVNPGSPFIVLIGFFVQQGVFWPVVYEAVGKLLAQ